MFSRFESGQATVEAAFLLPALLFIFGLLLQPMILLYNRCVMQSAAAEGCRMVATNTQGEDVARAYVLRRLGAIPNAPVFHEGGSEQWKVELTGAEASDVSVTIKNHAHPLPLFGVVAGLSNQKAGDGCIEQEVKASASLVPSWAKGGSPGSWIGGWK